MGLSFRADDLLQELVPKHRVRFLLVRNQQVRAAIKERGELWRISPLPKTPDEMNRMIGASRIAIRGNELYYYSKATGTRLLTYESFSELKGLGDASLRQHLAEIREFSAGVNRYGSPEIGFFMAGEGISKADFAPHDFATIDAETLRNVYDALLRKFADAVAPKFHHDSVANLEWRNAMYAALIGEDEKTACEESLLGLSCEFFMQIEWLPGGRIEEGELIFDSVLDLAEVTNDPELRRLCDDKCRGFIYNFVREYGDLEYVNIGRVVGSLSYRTAFAGRRNVYIAQVKQRGIPEEIVKIVRMQKWGIREHLNDGKKLLDAIIQAEEYTEYILDRRLGCRQLGMNLPARTTAKRISERYVGPRRDLCNAVILVALFRARLHPRHRDRQNPAAMPGRRGVRLPVCPAPGTGGGAQHDRGAMRHAGQRGVRRRGRGRRRERRRIAGRDHRRRSNGDIRRLSHRSGALRGGVRRAGQPPSSAPGRSQRVRLTVRQRVRRPIFQNPT